MTKLPLRYVNEYRDVRGKVRRYFRRPGHKRIPLPGLPGSDEFMAAYQAALGQAARIEIGVSRTVPGTIDALVVDYFKSDAFHQGSCPRNSEDASKYSRPLPWRSRWQASRDAAEQTCRQSYFLAEAEYLAQTDNEAASPRR